MSLVFKDRYLRWLFGTMSVMTLVLFPLSRIQSGEPTGEAIKGGILLFLALCLGIFLSQTLTLGKSLLCVLTSSLIFVKLMVFSSLELKSIFLGISLEIWSFSLIFLAITTLFLSALKEEEMNKEGWEDKKKETEEILSRLEKKKNDSFSLILGGGDDGV